MARPKLYPTAAARQAAYRARQAGVTPIPDLPALERLCEPLEPPVDAVVALFDAAARRVAKNTFDTQIKAAKAKLAQDGAVNPVHFLRENLLQLAVAMRADFMGEAEVLLKRCL